MQSPALLKQHCNLCSFHPTVFRRTSFKARRFRLRQRQVVRAEGENDASKQALVSHQTDVSILEATLIVVYCLKTARQYTSDLDDFKTFQSFICCYSLLQEIVGLKNIWTAVRLLALNFHYPQEKDAASPHGEKTSRLYIRGHWCWIWNELPNYRQDQSCGNRLYLKLLYLKLLYLKLLHENLDLWLIMHLTGTFASQNSSWQNARLLPEDGAPPPQRCNRKAIRDSQGGKGEARSGSQRSAWDRQEWTCALQVSPHHLCTSDDCSMPLPALCDNSKRPRIFYLISVIISPGFTCSACSPSKF